MRSNEDTIRVPKRFIFIMIFVSLGINIFFLLMGILIGKEDLKWKREAAGSELPVNQVTQDEPVEDSLEQDLSLFEAETDTQREAPIDVSDLISQERVSTEPPPSKTSSSQTDPGPSANSASPPTRSEPGPTSPQKAPAFWVQVLASKERQKANEFLGRLRTKGLEGMVFQEGGYHKVQIGPYNTRAIAEVAKKKIDQDFKTKSWIRKK